MRNIGTRTILYSWRSKLHAQDSLNKLGMLAVKCKKKYCGWCVMCAVTATYVSQLIAGGGL